VVIASLLRPLTNYISQTHFYNVYVPRFVAILISFTVLVVILGLFIVLFIPLINEQIQILSAIDYVELLGKMMEPVNRIEIFLIRNNLTAAEEGTIVSNLKDQLVGILSPNVITDFINNLISLAGSFMIGFIAVVFITFFLLYEKGLFRKAFIAVIPNKYFEVSIAAINKVEKLLSNYLLGLLFQMFSIFTIASVGLSILGIKYAITIGLFAAVANLIPYLGPLLGAGFGILVGLSTNFNNLNASNDYIFLILKIVVVFSVVQVTDNLVLQPVIFSKSVKAHPLEIFIIIFAGATLAGIPGMIAAIPVYTVIRVSVIELFNGYREYKIFRIN
jgi:predicted PurR-regulated permease PerM